MEAQSGSFFLRHQFLILRLHSLSGLLPVGAYMTVHLLTNASTLGGPAMFQKNVDLIHSLGPALAGSVPLLSNTKASSADRIASDN